MFIIDDEDYYVQQNFENFIKYYIINLYGFDIVERLVFWRN